MEIKWLKPGYDIEPGLEEGSAEITFYPGIPMDIIFSNQLPQHPQDAEERDWLINASSEIVKEFEENILTRRGLFYNLYPSSLKINCFSIFHFMVRKNKLELFVYSRSMNMKNMGYDLNTVDKVYNNVLEKLKQIKDVDLGLITFRIASLHFYKNT